MKRFVETLQKENAVRQTENAEMKEKLSEAMRSLRSNMSELEEVRKII